MEKFGITTNDLLEDFETKEYLDFLNFAREEIERLAKQRADFIDNKLLEFGINKENINDYGLDIQYDLEGTETFTLYKKEIIGGFNIKKIDYN